MIIVIGSPKHLLTPDAIKHGDDAIQCLCDMGNYLRGISDKGDADDISSDIYNKLVELMDYNNLNREIVGF